MFQFVTTTMKAYFTNRLLDLAHSRYRPGVALRYKQVDTSHMDVKDIKKCRQTTYYCCRGSKTDWRTTVRTLFRGVGRISDMGGQIILIEANARIARENFSYRKSRPLIKRPLTPNPFTD